MSLKNLDRDSDPADWDKKWSNIFDHYQQDIRHAHYVRALLRNNNCSVLEIAAGSFRDMAALNRMGVDCGGMDFSRESVERAQIAFPQYVHKIRQMSAFDMEYEDKAFDVTYHNGFWVLFDDQKISELAREQARITKNQMIVTVHNGNNQNFVDYFDCMKKSDPLYDIRFFKLAEIKSLMESVCDEVSVIPVGKGKRRHEIGRAHV